MKQDFPLLINEENGRNGQETVAPGLERYTEGGRSLRSNIGIKAVIEFRFFLEFRDFFRAIRTERHDLITELFKIRSDVLQLTQLPCAEWSPPAAIKNQDGRLLFDDCCQVDVSAITFFDRYMWHFCADQQGMNLVGRRRGFIGRMRHEGGYAQGQAY